MAFFQIYLPIITTFFVLACGQVSPDAELDGGDAISVLMPADAAPSEDRSGTAPNSGDSATPNYQPEGIVGSSVAISGILPPEALETDRTDSFL